MGLLGKKDILDANDVTYDVVATPEWGGDVRVRGAMACERDQYEANLFHTETKDGVTTTRDSFVNAKALLIVQCIVDEDGDRLFKDEDATAVAQKSAAASDRIFKRIKELSGMTKKAKETIAGNSGPGQTNSSSSS